MDEHPIPNEDEPRERLPDFYDDLNLTLQQVWHLLEDGKANRRAAAHTPCVASCTADGRPSQRIMVLRGVNRQAGHLTFHTDVRSPKVSQLDPGQPASVLVYDRQNKVQLRLSGTACIVHQGEGADASWKATSLFGQRCYLAIAAPGTPVDAPTSGLPADIEGIQPTAGQTAPARVNFARLDICADEIDWLYLANAGHRRALFTRAGDSWTGRWLVP